MRLDPTSESRGLTFARRDRPTRRLLPAPGADAVGPDLGIPRPLLVATAHRVVAPTAGSRRCYPGYHQENDPRPSPLSHVEKEGRFSALFL